MAEKSAKKPRLSKTKSDYIDCRFILGSSAEVERIFSIGGNLLSKNRRSMTSQVFEAILFLKYNSRLWDLNPVSEATTTLRDFRRGNTS